MLQTKPRLGPQKWRANHYSGFFIAAGVRGLPNVMEETYGCHLPKSHPEPEEQAVTESNLCWA